MPEFILNGESVLTTRTPLGVINPVRIDTKGQRIRFEEPSAFKVSDALSAAFGVLYGRKMLARERRLHERMTVGERIGWLAFAVVPYWPGKPAPRERYSKTDAGTLRRLKNEALMRRAYATLNSYPWPIVGIAETTRAGADLARKEARASAERDLEAADKAKDAASAAYDIARKVAAEKRAACKTVNELLGAQDAINRAVEEASAEMKRADSAYGVAYKTNLAAFKAADERHAEAIQDVKTAERYLADERKQRENRLGWATIGERWDQPNEAGLYELHYLLTGRLP